MRLQSLSWLSLLRAATLFPSRRASPVRLARRVFSPPPILPAPRETSLLALAFRDSRATLPARFPTAADFLSEISLPSRRFFSALLQTPFQKPASMARRKHFSPAARKTRAAPHRGLHFPSIPFAR